MSTPRRNLSVCLSPALLPHIELSDKIVVVIDIFRATTSICYGLSNGAKAIIPVSTIDECASFKDSGYLLAAERNGKRVEGFDLGNSPFSYEKENIAGKTIVLTTTNGTKALSKAKEAKEIIIGSFLNLTAVASYLQAQELDIVLLCAGWKNQFCLEDTLFAGAVVEKLVASSNFVLDDSAMGAEDLYKAAKDNLSEYLSKSSHGERLKKLNIQRDIAFCLQMDVITGVPILKNEELVLWEEKVSI